MRSKSLAGRAGEALQRGPPHCARRTEQLPRLPPHRDRANAARARARAPTPWRARLTTARREGEWCDRDVSQALEAWKVPTQPGGIDAPRRHQL